MTPRPARIVIVIAPERFRDEELAVPRHALERAGHTVTVVSTRPGTATGMLGARVDVARSIAQVHAEDCDALLIAGGAGAPAHLWDHEPLRVLVAAVHGAGRPVAAICLAPAVLARSGVLAGKRATTFPADRAILELKRGGATYVREAVVQDGTIVTADGPEAAERFATAVATLIPAT
jgi:protease I